MSFDDLPGEPSDALSRLTSPRRLAVRVAGFVVLLAAVALLVRSLPDLDDIRARLADADAVAMCVVATLEVGSVLGFAAALRGAFSNVPPWSVALELGTTEQGANVLLPAGGVGGLALGAAIASDAGVPGHIAISRTVALFLVTSGVTFVGIVTGGLLAAPGIGDVAWYGSLLPASFAALAIVAVILLPRALPPGAGRWRRRVSSSTRQGIEAAVTLVREPNLTLVFGAIAYFAFDVGALAVAFGAVGANALPVGAFLLAYALGQAGGMVPLPGGVGGVDGGLIGMFALYGAPLDEATAAVLAYRLFQLGVPVVFGLMGLAALKRRRRTQRDVPAVAARFEGVK